MVYLSTFTIKNQPNVGKYTINGCQSYHIMWYVRRLDTETEGLWNMPSRNASKEDMASRLQPSVQQDHTPLSTVRRIPQDIKSGITKG